MAGNQKVKYTGVLNKPIVRRTQGLFAAALMGDQDAQSRVEADLKDHDNQIRERIDALCRHYGVDLSSEDAFLHLAMALARDHVPGFRVVFGAPPRRGRRKRWQSTKLVELLADIWALEAQGKTPHSACRILASNPKYRSRYKGLQAATLYRRYQEARTSDDPWLQKLVFGELQKGAPVKDWVIGAGALDEDARKAADSRWNALIAELSEAN